MKISGTGKNDSLHGTPASDIINGGKGNDYIDGHGGDDILTGGAGADVFIFMPGGGSDMITDFNAQEGDIILIDYDGTLSGISTLSAATFASADCNADGAMDTTLYLDGSSVVLLGVNSTDLASHILLV